MAVQIRSTVALLLTLVAGGCGATSNPSPSPIAVASALVRPISLTPSLPIQPSLSPEPADPFVTPEPSPSAPSPVPSVDSQVTLPLIGCRSTGVTPRPRNSTEPLVLAERVAERVAVYSTTNYRVLALRDWRCDGAEGDNGTGLLTVVPPKGGERMIEYENDAVTYGDILWTACPVFPSAAAVFEELYGFPCPRAPEKEVLRREGNHVVWFKDPPGVEGTGAGSGGKYAAVGAVLYWAGEDRSAAKVTCVLPPRQRYLCNAIIEDTIRRLLTP